MAKQKVILSPQEKAKRDLKIAEIVYYSIGGIAMALGLVFSIFGIILLNPAKENFENFPLKIAENDFFKWLGINTTFANAGLVLMAIATIYFLIVFAIFVKQGDEVSKRSNIKKSRQRQVTFVAPVEPAIEAVASEKVESEVTEEAK